MNYRDYNDYELLYMVRENDDLSKNLLYEKYHPIVCKLASDFYNRYKSYGYDYEDFYQEALITLDSAIITYDENSTTLFYTYLISCIRKALLAFTRNISNTRKSISNKLVTDIEDIEIIDYKNDIGMEISFQQLQNILKSIIYDYDIPMEVGVMLELRMNGFTYREIGEVLSLSSSTVEFRFRKVRKLVKEKIEEYCKN